MTDRLVGFCLVAFSLLLFVYYTFWIVILVRGSEQYNPGHFTPAVSLGSVEVLVCPCA